ncbi:MAG: glycosyltransferase [Anaerolineae bacterium]|nr:glycosyltransferase [Anaerolineae bacterium]
MPERKPELVYLANNRLPTEKANGLQIAQMCEALAGAGYAVTLVAPRRFNTPDMRAVRSIWDHYGVERVFTFRRLPCLDLFPLFPRHHIAFIVQTFTFILALFVWLLPRRPAVIYTRDLFVAVVIVLVRPRTRLVYEAHQFHASRIGQRLERFLVRRAYNVPITGHLAVKLRDLGAARVLVEHDGVRLARFEDMPTRSEARAALNITPDAFVVGYVGRLYTLGMAKGLDKLVNAIADATGESTVIDLLLVGGPDEGVTAIREQWAARGLPAERLHTVGQVPPDDVPRYLAAMDVGIMPQPWTDHFAYYTSALKLFEYMAAGCAILSSDLPSTAEVVRDGESALLVPPDDVAAWAAALRRLAADRDLVVRLGAQARQDVQHYTWDARAARIRAFVENEG